MKRLISIFILSFFLIGPSYADDISDFQIEGMSIGDSLLNHMTKEQIEYELKNTDITVFYPDKKFASISLWVIRDKFKLYEDVGVIIKPNDKDFKIFGLEGTFFFGQDIEKCYKKQNEIFKIFKETFGDKSKINSWVSKNPSEHLKSAKYKDFNFDTKEQARLICYDSHEGYERKVDALYVVLNSSDFVTSMRKPDEDNDSRVEDDIRDFQIEGMSIGDSALDFFTEDKINNASKTNYPKSKKYQLVHILTEKSDIYNQVTITIKPGDKKYIIYSLGGDIHFKDDLEGCLNKKKEIVEEISSAFTNAKERSYTYKYETIDDGRSFSKVTDLDFEDGSAIRIYCNSWTKETEIKRNFMDMLTVSITTKEYTDWINNEAYD